MDICSLEEEGKKVDPVQRTVCTAPGQSRSLIVPHGSFAVSLGAFTQFY